MTTAWRTFTRFMPSPLHTATAKRVHGKAHRIAEQPYEVHAPLPRPPPAARLSRRRAPGRVAAGSPVGGLMPATSPPRARRSPRPTRSSTMTRTARGPRFRAPPAASNSFRALMRHIRRHAGLPRTMRSTSARFCRREPANHALARVVGAAARRVRPPPASGGRRSPGARSTTRARRRAGTCRPPAARSRGRPRGRVRGTGSG